MVVTKELSEAAVEMNIILAMAPKDFISKIPEKFRQFLKDIESQSYVFNYDYTKSLNEQNLKEETRGLIGLIYRDCICTAEKKDEYITKTSDYAKQKEIETREKYNPDAIFKNQKNNNIEEEVNQENLEMIVSEENFIKRIWKKIINIFKFK